MGQIAALASIFANNILPILLIAAVGVVLRRRFALQPQPIGTLIFNVLSPSLVFWLFYTSDVSGGEFVTLAGATVLFQLAMAALAFTVAGALGIRPVARANLTIASFCLNAGNYGLSLIAFAFDDAVLSRAAVVLVANVTMNYSLGVFIASNGRASVLQSLGNVARTPAIYAVLAAFTLRLFELPLPLALANAIETLSGAAIPMMLLMLGMQLGGFARLDQPRTVAAGVTLKLVVAPFVAFGIAALLGVSGPGFTAFLVQASTPTAVLTLIFASEFDLDRDLALNLIMTATLLSPVTLSLLVLLLYG